MKPLHNPTDIHPTGGTAQFRAVVMGVSAGGMDALSLLLPMLPANFPAPVLVVQHRMAGSGNVLAENLNRQCAIRVKEAEEKETIQPGCVYLAPADYHLLVERDETLSLSIDARECFCRPSINVLFETAAYAWADKLLGIILTGANSDGAAGLACIKENGGMGIVQDPDTALYDAMPRAAIAATHADFILNIQEIGLFLQTKFNNRQTR